MSGAPFYVGYLPLPAAWRRFVFGVAALALIVSTGAVLALAGAQPGSGTGSWATEEIVLEGSLTREPYPLLRAPDPLSPTRMRAWLLVGEGKHGVDDRVRAVLGDAPVARVRVRGLPLRRQDQRVLELVSDERALTPLLEPAAVLPNTVGDALDVEGEIIDPKCWVGAMRPGSGLVHRACAELCIRGGIPPCFVGGPRGAPPRFWVLTAADGTPCNDAVAALAGVLVHARAVPMTTGDVDSLRIDLATLALGPLETSR